MRLGGRHYLVGVIGEESLDQLAVGGLAGNDGGVAGLSAGEGGITLVEAYIRARSGMNTSESVLEALSDIVREHAERAIENARLDGRRTVMDRDFKP